MKGGGRYQPELCHESDGPFYGRRAYLRVVRAYLTLAILTLVWVGTASASTGTWFRTDCTTIPSPEALKIVCFDQTTFIWMYFNGSAWLPIAAGSGGGDLNAKYILQQAAGDLPNAQALGALATGFLVGTTSTGVVSSTPNYRNCTIIVGSDDADILLNADLGPQGRQCFIPSAATVVEITVAADGGTPNIIVAKNHAGSATNLISGALATASAGAVACSNAGGTIGIDGATTCSGTLTVTALAAGDWIQLTSGTAGGTAKRMSISITYSTP